MGALRDVGTDAEVIRAGLTASKWGPPLTEWLTTVIEDGVDAASFTGRLAKDPDALATAMRPLSIRGQGVLTLFEPGFVIVDSGPVGVINRTYEWADVTDVTKVGLAIVFTFSDGGAVAFQPHTHLEKILAAIRSLVDATGPAWADQVAGWPAPILADYLGGHPQHPNGIDSVTVTFDSTGVRVTQALKQVIWIRWADITGIDVEGADAVQKRITVTRLLTIGLFALGWRKRLRSSFVTFSTGNAELVMSSRKLSVHELRAHLSPITAVFDHHTTAAPATEHGNAPTATTADRLKDLQGLYNSGLITEAEYTTKRQAILDAL